MWDFAKVRTLKKSFIISSHFRMISQSNKRDKSKHASYRI